MALFDENTLERIAPVIRRVLIVDPSPYSAKMTGELVKGMGSRNIVYETDGDLVLPMAERLAPTLILLERTGARLDGQQVARDLRRSRLDCRKAPIIMMSSEATTTNILGARDAGVHEFLIKPFAAGDLARRLVNVATKPRDWIEGQAYVGPDRRRFNSGEYQGPKKRTRDQSAETDGTGAVDSIESAQPDLSGQGIVMALGRLKTDPAALRILMVQAEAIKAAALGSRRARLAVAAAELHAACAEFGPDEEALSAPVRQLMAAIKAAQPGAAA